MTILEKWASLTPSALDWVALRRNVIFPADLALTGNEFHIINAATENDLFPTFVLTLGIEHS